MSAVDFISLQSSSSASFHTITPSRNGNSIFCPNNNPDNNSDDNGDYLNTDEDASDNDSNSNDDHLNIDGYEPDNDSDDECCGKEENVEWLLQYMPSPNLTQPSRPKIFLRITVIGWEAAKVMSVEQRL